MSHLAIKCNSSLHTMDILCLGLDLISISEFSQDNMHCGNEFKVFFLHIYVCNHFLLELACPNMIMDNNGSSCWTLFFSPRKKNLHKKHWVFNHRTPVICQPKIVLDWKCWKLFACWHRRFNLQKCQSLCECL